MTRLQRLRQGKTGPVFGAAVYFNDPMFIEMCAYLGFQVMWIEMEHSHITFAEAVNLCRISQGCGLVTMIRIPNAARENVLKAAECGPDIINVPMANSAHVLHELIRYARFSPVGERGYFSVSRAVKYGAVADVPAEQQKLNDELCLMARSKLRKPSPTGKRLQSAGSRYLHRPFRPGRQPWGSGADGNSRVEEAGRLAIQAAKKCGKLVAVGAQPADFNMWVKAGVEYCSAQMIPPVCRLGAETILQRARDAVSQASKEATGGKIDWAYPIYAFQFGTKANRKWNTGILKHTDLKVSRLCFGTMTFGKPADQTTATQMIDRCIDEGINFIDTANVYQTGVAESMLGEAIRGKREKLILATKVRGKMGRAPTKAACRRRQYFKAIDDSLKRLKTDYVDLYYLHQPDKTIPVEESLLAMEELVRQGKIRYPATSNYAGWQVAELLWMAEKQNYTPAFASQPMYNLLARGIEQEYLAMAQKYGVSVIAYNPLAGGMLTGKHSQSAIPPGTRFDKNPMYQERYWHS